MTGYSAVLLDHFEHPRNTGELEGANATAEGENPVCGDRFRVQLRIHDGVVDAMAWTAQGCVPAIAAASAASVLLPGMTVEEATRLNRDALTAVLGPIPPRKNHALALVVATLAQALNAYRSLARA